MLRLFLLLARETVRVASEDLHILQWLCMRPHFRWQIVLRTDPCHFAVINLDHHKHHSRANMLDVHAVVYLALYAADIVYVVVNDLVSHTR